MFGVKPNMGLRSYRPIGFLTPTTVIASKEETSIPITNSAICYNDLPYLLSSHLKGSTPSVPSGATLTNRWVFNPSDTSGNSCKSFTLEKGTSAQAERIVGAVMRDLNLRWTHTDASLTGSMQAQYLTELVTITPTPTDIAALPIDPKSISVYVGSAYSTNNVQTVTITGTPTGGTFTLTFENQTTTAIAYNANAATVQAALRVLTNLGINVTVGGGPGPGTPWTLTFSGLFAGVDATPLTADGALLTGGTSPAVAVTNTTPGGMLKLLRPNTTELSLPERKAFNFTLNDATRSWDYFVEKGSDPVCNLQVMHDAVGAAMMAVLRARTIQYCKILCRGPVIETVSTVAWPAALQITFPFRYIGNDRDDVDDAYMSTYPLALQYDSGFGGSLNMTVDTYVASL